jgi:hypothetical protein
MKLDDNDDDDVDHVVSEQRPQIGLLFIPQVIYVDG